MPKSFPTLLLAILAAYPAILAATGYDMNQANSSDFSVKKQDDISLVRIGQERYKIPDAVIYGG